MKSKIITLFLLMLWFSSSMQVVAQDADSKPCKDDQKIKENLSIYFEYYKSKNYADAYTAWKYVFDNCPGAHKNIFIHGPKFIEFKMENAKTEAEKQKYQKELMSVFDSRLVYFPGDEGYVLGLKGSMMVQYRIGSSKEAYDVLRKAFELDGSKLQASTLYSYFTAATRLFNEEKFDYDDIFRVYEEVVEAVDLGKSDDVETIAAFEQKIEDGQKLSKEEDKKFKSTKNSLNANEIVEANIEKIISKIATCENLEALYSSKFNERKQDISWINGAVNMMTRKKCFESQVFFKLVSEKSKLDPSASSSRVAGLLSLQNKQYSKALDYYNEAIKLGTDNNKKADDYFKAAQALFQLDRKSESRSYAYKALDLKPKWGDPYILIGDLYASSANDCGSNVFEKKAVYWAAIDKYFKARTVDPKVSKRAAEKIKGWSSQVPDKTMIFQFGYIGKPKYTINCWIGETVDVPQN